MSQGFGGGRSKGLACHIDGPASFPTHFLSLDMGG